MKTVLTFLINFLKGCLHLQHALSNFWLNFCYFQIKSFMLQKDLFLERKQITILSIKNHSKQSTSGTLLTQYTHSTHTLSPLPSYHFPSFLTWTARHLMKNMRWGAIWWPKKKCTHKFAYPDSFKKILTKWSNVIFIYKQEGNNIANNNPLNYQAFYPKTLEKQNIAGYEYFQQKSYFPVGTLR